MINRRTMIRGGSAAAVAGAGALAFTAGVAQGTPASDGSQSPNSAGADATPAAKVPAFLPLPASVKPLPDNGKGYRIQRAGKNAYVVIVGFVQSVFVVTRSGVVLVDAPPASRGKLKEAIASVTDKPVTHFIYSHSHLDHVGAVNDFPDAVRIAHADCATILALHKDPARPMPQKVLHGKYSTLHIGGEEIHIIYPGANHEAGNVLTYFPKQRLAVMTDVVMPGWAPYRGWGNADYLPGILSAHDAILELDFDTYVGGHVYRTGTRADVKQSRAFFVDFWNTTKKNMGSIPFSDAAAQVEPENAWAAQKVWIDRVAKATQSELVERWGTEIAAVDTFTADTAGSVVVSISTDATINFP
ncbi:MBL fold metallo-hydrolase [Streptomyces sp. NBC_01092]|uniref:MBL fold metallo-hydrolase n=1 Tax=Streptomyces sp. NBC_01092 TaxID=2903748 RepID=UPI00386E0209|nr:MBL fold metallo-hydrolase [Streptomyces sp. NBC_01092]